MSYLQIYCIGKVTFKTSIKSHFTKTEELLTLPFFVFVHHFCVMSHDVTRMHSEILQREPTMM